MKRAMICGISGQDGAHLAAYLLTKGYAVHGTSRDVHLMSNAGLRHLGIAHQVQLHSMAINDFRSVLSVLSAVKPHEVYNLAGQSSVGLSFEQPVEAMESIAIGALNLLEAIRFHGSDIRFYNAGSSECYGDTGDKAADETTAFRPCSPYGVAKATAFWQVANYREAYGLHASSGILFNHESPIRPARFVTRKVVATACRIARGARERLVLGDISIERDWGWSADYVQAMWAMTQRSVAGDFVVATGRTVSLADFVNLVFSELGLSWRDHVDLDPSLHRPNEIRSSRANAQRIRSELGWRPQHTLEDMIRMMVQHELQGLRANNGSAS